EKPEKVLKHLEKSLSLFEEHGNQRNISSVVYNMAIENYRLRNVAKARELAEYSLSFMRQLNDKVSIARRVTALAVWDMVEEEFERASDYLAEAQMLSQEMGEEDHFQYALYIQGILFTIKGEYESAKATLHKSLELAHKLSKLDSVASCHSNLGQLFLMDGDVDGARPHIVQSLETLQGSVFQPWATMMVYANYLWHLGDLEACAPIVATMSIEFEQMERGEAVNNHYFLRPLIYRVKQKLGETNWQSALKAAEGVLLKDHFEQAINSI
ncbi:MAG: hypothetical protein AAGD96_35685, partial [Chloroflexota bacterium]